MGAQSSHLEPLNMGGTGPNAPPPPPPPSAPDFSHLNHTNPGPRRKTSLVTKAMNPRSTVRKSIRKRNEKRARNKENRNDSSGGTGRQVEGPTSSVSTRSVAMDRLRRSFRDSFRKKKESSSEASKPHQWQHDEAAVRAATCAFPVKYLGCVEVFESRGMQVCEEALKVLRASRRRPIRGMLHVSGDGLRVVDDETKGLLVDQTIEKVSFCAPDRNHERGFSYICRDGTTRRWMCHGFVAIKETGERLSHAVGCAFAACLDRKQKRDKECGVTMTFDQSNSTFTRMGSFKQMSITERLADPQECKPTGNNGLTSPTGTSAPKSANPHAIARPHATPLMLQRQGSCRAFHHLNQSSPFKRQLSLRLNDLPSNLERQRDSNSLIDNLPPGGQSFPSDAYNNNSPALPAGALPRSKAATPIIMSAIPEAASESSGTDPVSAMCQQLSQELSLMSSSTAAASAQLFTHSTAVAGDPSVTSTSPFVARPVSPKVTGSILVPSVEPIREEVPWSSTSPTSCPTTTATNGGVSKAEEWLAQFSATSGARVNGVPAPVASGTTSGQRRNPPLSQLRSNTVASSQPQHVWNPVVPATDSVASIIPAQMMPISSQQQQRQVSNFSTTLPSNARPEPLDMPWPSVPGVPATNQPPVVNPNNPFLPAASKAFEVQM